MEIKQSSSIRDYFMDENNLSNQIDIRQIIKEAFLLYKNNFQPFILVGLFYGFAGVVDGILYASFKLKPGGITFLLNILITSWASMVLVEMSSRAFQNKTIDLREAFMSPKQKYWNYVVVACTFFLLLTLGFLFFILPGIFFATIFIFADIVVILENRIFIDAFKRSAQLVSGLFGRVLLFSLLTALIILIPTLILGLLAATPYLKFAKALSVVATVFIAPFVISAQVRLYYAVKAIKKDEEVYDV